jgi:hypothetical protein
MLCSFKFELPVDPIALIDMIKKEIVAYGGRATGQSPNVAISVSTPLGPVEGSVHLLKGSTVNVVVDRMPEFVSCNAVREKLVFFITEAVKMYVAQTSLPPRAAPQTAQRSVAV